MTRHDDSYSDHDDDAYDEADDELTTEPLEYVDGCEKEDEKERVCLHYFHCVCATMPGWEWTAHVTVYDDGDELLILQRAGNYCRSDRVPHIGESWREVARFLAHDDECWALPECAAYEVNLDDDLPKWQDALLRLSWVRDGEEKEFSPGTILCELPQAWLEGLGGRYDLSDTRWNWTKSALIRNLRRLHYVASNLDVSPVTMLLQAAAGADPDHGLKDDPNGFRRALGRAFMQERETVRDTAW